MKTASFRKLVAAAVLTALTCISTLILTIPSPLGGYVNLGDTLVLLSGWLLGPAYGFAAAGIGSALADLLAGYAIYIPGTLLIKGTAALIAAVLLRRLSGKQARNPRLLRTLSAVAAECFMVFGYFVFAALVLSAGLGALATIPGNLAQGAIGAAGGLALMRALDAVKLPDIIKGEMVL